MATVREKGSDIVWWAGTYPSNSKITIKSQEDWQTQLYVEHQGLTIVLSGIMISGNYKTLEIIRKKELSKWKGFCKIVS